MKVINWLFGSFFRTIGRTIAILLMGGLLYYILASNGVGISDLFLDNVKADSVGYVGVLNYKDSSGNTLPGITDTSYSYVSLNDSGDSLNAIIVQFTENSFNNTNTKLYIPFLLTNIATRYTTITIANKEYECATWTERTGGGYTCLTWMARDGKEAIPRETNISFNVSLRYKNIDYSYINCSVENDKIACPLFNSSTIVYDRIVIYYTSNLTTPPRLALNRNVTAVKEDSAALIQEQQETTDAINSQTQQQQQQHQEMMNSTTTEAENEGSSFFGNFTTEDHGGLNSIITAPLNTIRSLLNSSCTNLTLPLPFVNKNLTLPCMNAIYTEHFGLFFSLYQTIILAIISYRCLRSIFFDITGFTNPDDDRIEVMDL